jgi:hypothetical protein
MKGVIATMLAFEKFRHFELAKIFSSCSRSEFGEFTLSGLKRVKKSILLPLNKLERNS